MSEGQKDHCGADSWWKPARWLLSKILNRESCRIHDEAWSEPGADKSKADKEFLKSQFSWYRPWTYFTAPIAYAAVSWGGHSSFKAAQEKALEKTRNAEK